MCEMWFELACRPVIFNSMLVDFGLAISVIVPFDLTEESAGFSLKVKTLPGVGEVLPEAEGLGVGKIAEPGEAPQAATHSTIEARASQHRVLGIPQQVTGAGRELSLPGPLRVESDQAWCTAGGVRRRERQKP
jgi:hypothetical protein